VVVGDVLRVLGVDPGTIRTGWGVVECRGSVIRRVDSGVIFAGRGEVSARLAEVYSGLSAVIARLTPTILSLERNFLATNVQSAFRLGEARGVAMAAAAAARVTLHEYTPATIKKTVVGHGRAGKSGVQDAVTRMLALASVPLEDEADALAAAICYGLRGAFENKIAAALDAGSRRVRLVRR
jgi:crossover junction endodeoxyribonuclease RuvC